MNNLNFKKITKYNMKKIIIIISILYITSINCYWYSWDVDNIGINKPVFTLPDLQEFYYWQAWLMMLIILISFFEKMMNQKILFRKF
jgi:xanthine/uracil permease